MPAARTFASLLLVGSLGAIVGWSLRGQDKANPPEAAAPAGEAADYCELIYYLYGWPGQAVFRTEDPKFIGSLKRRLEEARRDPQPAKYVHLGDMRLLEGGHTREMMLFLPFGHYRENDKYYIADFEEWRELLLHHLSEMGSALSKKPTD